MKTVAVSACLLGRNCRYDGETKRNDLLVEMLQGCKIVPFCPEDSCFGTPRPSMDLVQGDGGEIFAICSVTGSNLTAPIREYALEFFAQNSDIGLYIGKDRSPSCGVSSARIYKNDGELLDESGTGIMSDVANRHLGEVIDAEEFISSHI